MTDTDLAALAGCGSYDGYQETAGALLLARLTARRAAQLDERGTGPQHDFRLAAEAYVEIAEAELRIAP